MITVSRLLTVSAQMPPSSDWWGRLCTGYHLLRSTPGQHQTYIKTYISLYKKSVHVVFGIFMKMLFMNARR